MWGSFRMKTFTTFWRITALKSQEKCSRSLASQWWRSFWWQRPIILKEMGISRFSTRQWTKDYATTSAQTKTLEAFMFSSCRTRKMYIYINLRNRIHSARLLQKNISHVKHRLTDICHKNWRQLTPGYTQTYTDEDWLLQMGNQGHHRKHSSLK